MNKTAMGVAYDTKTAEEPDKKEEKRGAGPGGSVGAEEPDKKEEKRGAGPGGSVGAEEPDKKEEKRGAGPGGSVGAEEPDKKEEKRGAGPGGSVGWVCPVCGRGMSPYAHSCPCRGFGEVTCSVNC